MKFDDFFLLEGLFCFILGIAFFTTYLGTGIETVLGYGYCTEIVMFQALFFRGIVKKWDKNTKKL